jgi:peptidyl-prolyl cis-trans isomerase SurA
MKRIVLLVVLLQLTLLVQAGKNPKDTTLFTYGSKKVTTKEFYKGFNKNKKDSAAKPAEVDEYLELYKKFKLKVQDAYDLGLDTTESYKTELASYRKQIAKPYMTVKVVNDQLVNEAYERMKYEVKASHILVFARPDASPEDTLKAFNKLNQVRQDIESGKITFEQAALTNSEDPSAADNQGSLGYFTAFQMIYEFENQAFNTPVGQVSKVFRTEFGYHIVKVFDKRLSKGDIAVRQILIQTNPSPSREEVAEAEAKINEVYKKLQAGEKFATLVQQYSEDAPTVLKNGDVTPFSMTNVRLYDNYKTAAFSLQADGDYTKPLQTPSGFYILQRISLKPIGSVDEMRQTLLNKIGRDSRQYRNTKALYEKAKKLYGFSENKAYQKVLLTGVDSSLLIGEFDTAGLYVVDKKGNKVYNKKVYSQKLFSLKSEKKNYVLKDFVLWLHKVQKPVNSKALPTIVNNYYEAYKLQTIMDYYENDLENINDSFATLYKEYKEGILLFTLTTTKVWNKSVEDSVGLKKFYNEHTDKYVFKDRYEATIFRCANKTIAEAVKRDLEAGLTVDSIVRKTNRSNPLNVSNPSTGKYELGNNMYANFLFESGKTDTKFMIVEDPKTKGGYVVIQVHQFIPASKKTLNEARGSIISDYQNFLEKEWIDSLLVKYPVTVDMEAYNRIKARMTGKN